MQVFYPDQIGIWREENWIRSTVTLPNELRGRTEKVGDDLGGESRRRESKGTYEPFRVNSLFTICVPSATRHNIHMLLTH